MIQLAAASDLIFHMACLLAGVGTFIFVFTGYLLFSVGWESYEERYVEGAERTLDDLFLTIPPQQLLWLSLLSALAGFALVVLATNDPLVGFALGGLCFFGPNYGLRVFKKRRQAKFSDQLVAAMTTLTNALRSGFALPKAFQLIASDMPKPICQEFGILVQELRLGIDTDEGLQNMLRRVPSQDLDLLATSIAISASVGGNLAEVFDRIAETVRERHRIEGRIDALTAQGKMQGLMVSVLPIIVGVAINFIDPELMRPLLTTPIGWGILAVMIIMEGLGYFFVRKITSIEV